jgi:Flp pilus assembly protein TadG
MRDLLKSLHRNEEGTTAVEFAIVSPVFIAMLFGVIGLCITLFLIAGLHFAVEDGARCASVKTNICVDAASTVAYTQSHYMGPNVSPTFSYSDAPCGKSVTGTINYSMDLGFRTFALPISATACYP